jgi:hypothetical protein
VDLEERAGSETVSEYSCRRMEADSEGRLREWTVHWNDLTDFEIIPVRTSAEAAAAIAPEV